MERSLRWVFRECKGNKKGTVSILVNIAPPPQYIPWFLHLEVEAWKMPGEKLLQLLNMLLWGAVWDRGDGGGVALHIFENLLRFDP